MSKLVSCAAILVLTFPPSNITIHGLNGHRDKTWTALNGVHWLRDLLTNDIPNARILCWGYDANTYGNSHVSCQYLYDHARSLVSDLCLERRLTNVGYMPVTSGQRVVIFWQTTRHPVIFVAHSLGGIIVKSVSLTFHLLYTQLTSLSSYPLRCSLVESARRTPIH